MLSARPRADASIRNDAGPWSRVPDDAADGAGTSGADVGSPDAEQDGEAVEGGMSASRAACTPISIDSGGTVDGSMADTYAWLDARCHPRTAVLLRNDVPDGLGETGGYARELTYQADDQQRTCTGTGAEDFDGFGYVVAHYGNADADVNTKHTLGTRRVVLAGRHHAIHEFRWNIAPGGPVDVTVQWFFATGRDNPLFAVTFDSTPAGPNVVMADTRTPYGDIGWDDDSLGNVDGLGWGDKYQFATTGPGPVVPGSPWDYTVQNTVPYAMEWSSSADAEMGLVATQTWSTRLQGGDYGGGLLEEQWGKTGDSLLTDLPEWLWPFQLNQYELTQQTSSHRVAWGATFGAVGQSAYSAFGQTLSGYPFDSYSVFVVLGTHSEGAVAAQAKEIQTVQAATLTAGRGTVSSAGPAGVAQTSMTPYIPFGFDPIYAAWDARLDLNRATLTLTIPGGALVHPVFHLRDYTATQPPSRVTRNGRVLVGDVDYFATVDLATQSLWLTLNATATGSETLTIDP
jgi:hypothetical protein